ncbi:tetratricopeptide repeat protein [bacterium]|nr:tetratricopeptide repeat protein [bacterium]
MLENSSENSYDFTNLKADEPTSVEALFQRGQHLVRSGNMVEGLNVLAKLLDIDPNHTETVKLIGKVYNRLGKKEKAKQMKRLARAKDSSTKISTG